MHFYARNIQNGQIGLGIKANVQKDFRYFAKIITKQNDHKKTVLTNLEFKFSNPFRSLQLSVAGKICQITIYSLPSKWDKKYIG